MFFGKIGRFIKRAAKVVAPIAKRLAPIAAKALIGAIPGVGAVAGPLAGKLVGTLLREAELEVSHMEHQFVNELTHEGETAHPEVHEALLSELMAAQASAAPNEAEAEAMMAATIPLTIRFMRADRALLPVTPGLVQANARLVRVLGRQGRGD